MRPTISITLVFLISWQLLLKGGVFVWFGLNQAYIAQNLCVNRDKPEMHCNGKCVLMKRLQAAEEEHRQAQERPLRLVEKLDLSHFVLNQAPKLTNIFNFISTAKPRTDFFSVVSAAYLFKMLKPPELPA